MALSMTNNASVHFLSDIIIISSSSSSSLTDNT